MASRGAPLPAGADHACCRPATVADVITFSPPLNPERPASNPVCTQQPDASTATDAASAPT